MLPNLFFLGFPKCGSTSWYYTLKSSPEVLASRSEESPVFSRHDLTHNQLASLEMKEYSLYSGQRWVLNAHPLSIYSKTTLQYIKEHIKHPRFIICMRDPIKRTISHYNHLRSLAAENRCLRDRILSEVAEGDVWVEDQTQYYMRHIYFHQSRYHLYLENLFKVFSRDQCLFLGFENFFGAKREGQLRIVSDFLDIPPLREVDVHANKTVDVRVDLITNKMMTPAGDDKQRKDYFVERAVLIVDKETEKVMQYLVDPSDYSWNWFKQAVQQPEPDYDEIRDELGCYFRPAYDYVNDTISPEITSNWEFPD